MKIGILMAGHFPLADRPELGDYDALYSRLLDGFGFTFESYAVVDLDFPAEVTQCDGWLISGSRHGAYEDHPFIPLLEDFIRRAHAANVPMVGICFGHQIIAQALGGRVEKFAGGWSVGLKDYDFDGDTLSMNAWHQDQVIDLPEGATRLASNDFCANAAAVYGDRILTIQPHPEFESVAVHGLAEVRKPGKIPDDLVDAALARTDLPNDNARAAAMIATFFKERRVA